MTGKSWIRHWEEIMRWRLEVLTLTASGQYFSNIDLLKHLENSNCNGSHVWMWFKETKSLTDKNRQTDWPTATDKHPDWHRQTQTHTHGTPPTRPSDTRPHRTPRWCTRDTAWWRRSSADTSSSSRSSGPWKEPRNDSSPWGGPLRVWCHAWLSLLYLRFESKCVVFV